MLTDHQTSHEVQPLSGSSLCGIVGAQGKLQAEGCAWLEHWLQGCSHLMGKAQAPRKPYLGLCACLALQEALWGCSGASPCVLFPLCDHKSSSQAALTPMAANTSTYMCVYMLCPGGAVDADAGCRALWWVTALSNSAAEHGYSTLGKARGVKV